MGRPSCALIGRWSLGDAALSPDGRTLALVHPDEAVEAIDVDHAAAPRAAEPIRHGQPRRFTPGRALHRRRKRQRLGAAVVHQDLAARHARTRRISRRGRRTVPMSPDGRTLATGSIDGSVRLYDLSTRSNSSAHDCPPCSTAAVTPQFTPDGAYLFAISDAGRAYRWDVGPRRGRITRAPWPAARLPQPSGTPPYPAPLCACLHALTETAHDRAGARGVAGALIVSVAVIMLVTAGEDQPKTAVRQGAGMFVMDDFESGALNGWQAVGGGSGGWFVYSDGQVARSGSQRSQRSLRSSRSAPGQVRGGDRDERAWNAHPVSGREARRSFQASPERVLRRARRLEQPADPCP